MHLMHRLRKEAVATNYPPLPFHARRDRSVSFLCLVSRAARYGMAREATSLNPKPQTQTFLDTLESGKSREPSPTVSSDATSNTALAPQYRVPPFPYSKTVPTARTPRDAVGGVQTFLRLASFHPVWRRFFMARPAHNSTAATRTMTDPTPR